MIFSIRHIQIILACSLFLWSFLSGIVNLLEYEEHIKQVGFIMSMQGIPSPHPAEGRAISHPLIIMVAFAAIYLSKFLAAFFIGQSIIAMVKTRNYEIASFTHAKTGTIVGAAILIVMLFLGFITIGGLYFNMWQAGQLGIMAHDFAFAYLASIALILGVTLITEPHGSDSR